jgi:hypothetical protein
MKPRLLVNEHMTERQTHVHEHLQPFRLHTHMLLAFFETSGVHFACHQVLSDFLCSYPLISATTEEESAKTPAICAANRSSFPKHFHR